MQPVCFCVSLKEVSEEPECKKTSDKEQFMSDLKAKSHKTIEIWDSDVYWIPTEIPLVLSNLYENYSCVTNSSSR